MISYCEARFPFGYPYQATFVSQGFDPFVDGCCTCGVCLRSISLIWTVYLGACGACAVEVMSSLGFPHLGWQFMTIFTLSTDVEFVSPFFYPPSFLPVSVKIVQ